MRTLVASVALVACASNPRPICPKCYQIDEVAPYEPPRRMVILCDEPDAAVDPPSDADSD